MIAIEGCRKHEGYRAIQKPRSQCLPCWRMWFAADPDRVAEAIEFAAIDAMYHNRRDLIERYMKTWKLVTD